MVDENLHLRRVGGGDTAVHLMTIAGLIVLGLFAGAFAAALGVAAASSSCRHWL